MVSKWALAGLSITCLIVTLFVSYFAFMPVSDFYLMILGSVSFILYAFLRGLDSRKKLISIGIVCLIVAYTCWFLIRWLSIYSAALGGTFLLFWYLQRLDRRKGVATFTMKRLRAVALAFIILTGVLYGPSALRMVAYAASDQKAAAADAGVVEANTRFALSIIKELTKEDPGKNVFISPLSISTALTMTYNGAEGTTKEAMSRTLGLRNMTLSRVNEGNLVLLESLESVDDTIQLNLADSVWIESTFAKVVRQEFTSRVSTYFKSEVFTRPFDQSTVDEVNNWISDRTNGKIQKLLEQIDPYDVMFLVNAIYFKGDWTSQFKESATRDSSFHLADGLSVTASFMSQTAKFRYYQDENIQIARLPYGRDKVAMYIFLPAQGITIDSFIGNLTQQSLDDSFTRLHAPIKLSVVMPKFRIEYGTKHLNDALTNLGMGVAFDPYNANFNGIAPVSPDQNLFINFVDHKAYVDVNERGTEAAAVSFVVVQSVSAPPSFIVDRPFFFVIRDDRTGSILFMGKIENPIQTTSP